MDSIKLLKPPEYTEDERRALVDFILALKKTYVRDFLKLIELPVSGTKSALRDRIQEVLDDGDLAYEDVVDFLDSVALWGKQHVILYKGPKSNLKSWKDPKQVLQRLKHNRVGKLFNARLPLILPNRLTLSSITYSDRVLRITAVQRREYAERTPEHDDQRETEDGTLISLKAYIQHLSRILVSFEWDLNSNTAMLQITQLSRDTHYEEVAKAFLELVSGWLDIKRFAIVDIRRVIRNLHELEKNGKPEARSHGIHYRTLLGRRLSARSPSPRDSVFGETVIDNAMDNIRKKGVGHLGNFYWLPKVQSGPSSNPLQNDVHFFIVGDKSRINFPTPNSEEVIRYVLHRVRALS